MQQKSEPKCPNPPAETAKGTPPRPPAPRGARAALSKMHHVRTELAAVYREARGGKLDTQEATRLTYMLQVLARIIEVSEIEMRIRAVEERLGGG